MTWAEDTCDQLQKEIAQLKAEITAYQDAIHYPDCWDTACYETFLSALLEIGCNAEDCTKKEQSQ